MENLEGMEALTDSAYAELIKLTPQQKLDVIDELMMEYGNETQNFIKTWTNKDCGDPSQDDDPCYAVTYHEDEYCDMESDEYYEAKRQWDLGNVDKPIHIGL